ncbi:accessory Sec system glycosylation chaperone GtfB [Oenococcus oeni]|uniref:accessory Sec system glycosylation chaperone GtfB n=1 Tax=Oenococcus oeni TaxID=1247 RepID=UPI0008F93B5E|nr:accessory Sec system glycosylation chaperone GtfB [Oenococcus oeni]OIL37575.1 accessory Sec system glycosylation chaperone GtfB [Oenococcus oeni]SYW19953.1 Glycosyltransferase-stabilizing protein Gtf2 [Oenococcus oeni]
MINLFDNFDQGSQDLYQSLIFSGYDNRTVVINDNGFLPRNIISPYSFFANYYNEKTTKAKSFYQIQVPRFWEIKANGNYAEIFDGDQRRGKMNYFLPLAYHRIVETVEWFDRTGIIRSMDSYNCFGLRFAETIFDKTGRAVLKSYFNQFGQEIIVENFQTGNVILNKSGKLLIFKSKTEFLFYFFKESNLPLDRIVYNSLSTPMLVSYGLKEKGDDILFWSEKIKDEIPGNMQVILNNNNQRTKKIIFQNYHDYRRFQREYHGMGVEKVKYLSMLYRYCGKNDAKADALILTNSDQIEQFVKLVKALPEMHFSVASLTEMSSKLMKFSEFENVQLYPNVERKFLSKLISQANYYFDINHGNEILSAVRNAFMNQQLIFSFTNTCHASSYVSDELIYEPDRIDLMISRVKQMISNKKLLYQALSQQEKHLIKSTPEDYRKILQ